MKPYFRISIWETKKRLATLITFHADVTDYFNNSEANWMVDGRIDTDKSRDAMRRINMSVQTAHRIIKFSGVSSEIVWTPPPAVGGYIQNVDVILNLFKIGQFQISPDTVIGVIEQAIGVYTDDHAASWRRRLNPFWWLGRILSWFAHIPFALIGKAGFDASKAEGSFIGKLTSLIFYLTPFVAAVLTILHRLGYLDEAKTFFRLG